MRCLGIMFSLVVAVGFWSSSCDAQTKDLSELVGGTVNQLASGFKFTEGPAADRQGNVYFTDIPNERIMIWSIDGELKTHRENTGRANGLYFTPNGLLLACEGGARRMTSQSPKGRIKVLTDSYEGGKYNSPNDLWIDQWGGVYFTDPRYGSQDGKEQDGFHVYYIAPNGKTVSRVIDDHVKPNGIIGTSDNKTLYVADAGGGKTYAYSIIGPGKIITKRLLCESGSDGMTLDHLGNLYLTTSSVRVFNSTGKDLGNIAVPEGPANVTFGGEDYSTLFITAKTGLYSVKMKVHGDGR
ncbi:MAG: SMP-30/gluconolactonase/LRE family protein [Planctomycetaceae bacterium]|nr:SMP-30/gluconolactonase/LRE family protein [Planctomycetaceae bacterium]